MLPMLSDYRDLIALEKPFEAPAPLPAEALVPLVREALDFLVTESPAELVEHLRSFGRHSDRDRLRALLTARPPCPFLSPELQGLLDRLLASERASRATTEAGDLPALRVSGGSAFSLWQGDITALRVDAIVNAANDALLGCFQPFHRCIDNAIHAAAGPRLREDCERVMELQGFPEPTGHAKITRAYHLPSRFVLHTVGPIYRGHADEPGPGDCDALASSYRSCLDLAAEIPAIRSLAFPCISTGVFGFPAKAASRVAVETVTDWLESHPGRFERVVLNVFLDSDLALYRERLASSPA